MVDPSRIGGVSERWREGVRRVGFLDKGIDLNYLAKLVEVAQFLSAKRPQKIKLIGLSDSASTQMF